MNRTKVQSGGTCSFHGEYTGASCGTCLMGGQQDLGSVDWSKYQPYQEKAAKIRPSLLPHEAVVAGIEAMEFGAKKYGAEAWRTVDMQPVDFLNALERHLLAYKSGEKNAVDSGVSHLGHIIANCAILLVKFDLAKKHIHIGYPNEFCRECAEEGKYEQSRD